MTIEYLGQSKRKVGTRLKEYQKAVSTLDKGKSALAEHIQYVTPNMRLRRKTLK